MRGLLLLAGLACECAARGPVPQPAESGILEGVCEASALIWDGGRWLVGDNEVDDRLFAYDADFRPVGTVPVVPPVEDIEALAWDGARVLVVGSGGTKPERRRVVEVGGGERPALWDACAACGPVNVEGAAWWKGALWLGLRSPVPEGKTTFLEATTGQLHAQEWGGYGVRDMAMRGEELLLILGPTAKEERPYRLGSLEKGPLEVILPEGAEGLGVGPDGRLTVVTDGGWNKEMTGCKHPSRWQRIPG